jgi:hypothetical protein
MAAMGLLALLQQSAFKVHFVFANKHLKERDVKDF